VWDTLDEMNEGLIENINTDVKSTDTLLISGDGVMGQRMFTLPILERLNGTLELVAGNHDSCHVMNKKSSMWMEEYAKYFSRIDIDRYMEIDGIKLRFNHFPRSGLGDSHDEERYTKWRPEDDGVTWNIAGHVHSKDVFLGERQLHVGIDADFTTWGIERYHAIPLELIIEIIKENS
jgi:calcineurin-like phosphoesterase family protein